MLDSVEEALFLCLGYVRKIYDSSGQEWSHCWPQKSEKIAGCKRHKNMNTNMEGPWYLERWPASIQLSPGLVHTPFNLHLGCSAILRHAFIPEHSHILFGILYYLSFLLCLSDDTSSILGLCLAYTGPQSNHHFWAGCPSLRASVAFRPRSMYHSVACISF